MTYKKINFRTILTTCLLVVSLFLTACSVNTETDIDDFNDSTVDVNSNDFIIDPNITYEYENIQFGFTLEFPSNWELFSDSTTNFPRINENIVEHDIITITYLDNSSAQIHLTVVKKEDENSSYVTNLTNTNYTFLGSNDSYIIYANYPSDMHDRPPHIPEDPIVTQIREQLPMIYDSFQFID